MNERTRGDPSHTHHGLRVRDLRVRPTMRINTEVSCHETVFVPPPLLTRINRFLPRDRVRPTNTTHEDQPFLATRPCLSHHYYTHEDRFLPRDRVRPNHYCTRGPFLATTPRYLQHLLLHTTPRYYTSTTTPRYYTRGPFLATTPTYDAVSCLLHTRTVSCPRTVSCHDTNPLLPPRSRPIRAPPASRPSYVQGLVLSGLLRHHAASYLQGLVI